MSERVRILGGDCRRALRLMAARGVMVDSVVTDPPYHLTSIVKRFGAAGAAPAKDRDGLYRRASRGFMGKRWDGGDIAFDPETWRLVGRVLKPGGHLLAFGGTRGWHRMACAIEDAGFEVRDTVAWLYGSGFPKSKNQAKAIDALRGVEGETVPSGTPVRRMRPGADQHRDGHWEKLADRIYQPGDYIPATEDARRWDGWGTALKPAFEPIVLARKPLSEASIAANVLRHGTGAINVDGCRIEAPGGKPKRAQHDSDTGMFGLGSAHMDGTTDEGRWPANVAHDGSDEVEAAFVAHGDAPGAQRPVLGSERQHRNVYGAFTGGAPREPRGDSGSAARFFYSAKADADDRFGSKHPTVKPVDLMRWLMRLITPPGGLVLDPFAGSGTTGVAALAEGMRAVLIEREADYAADIRARLDWHAGRAGHSAAIRARNADPARTAVDGLPLFAGEAGE